MSAFFPFGELPAIFIKVEIVVCKFTQFGRVYVLSLGEGFKATLACICIIFSLRYIEFIICVNVVNLVMCEILFSDKE